MNFMLNLSNIFEWALGQRGQRSRGVWGNHDNSDVPKGQCWGI